VVHHGGIGTVAEAMATGLPQLVHPICFDQLDNGMRAKILGAGDCLRARRSTGKQIATALTALMTDQSRRTCREVKKRFDKTDALTTAAALVEQLAADRAVFLSS
jgi:UDP:flavonoid glycosyltransferase YjiC (YdhE family)